MNYITILKDIGMFVGEVVLMSVVFGALTPIILVAFFIGFQFPNKVFGITEKVEKAIINMLIGAATNGQSVSEDSVRPS